MKHLSGSSNEKASPRRRKRFFLPASAYLHFGIIDEEHVALVALLNDALDVAQCAGSTTERLNPLLVVLHQRFAEHFLHEEQAMEQIGYPSLEEHEQHHKELLVRLTAVCLDAREGKTVALPELEEFFASLLEDALSDDLVFKAYLESQGITPIARSVPHAMPN